MRGLRHVTTLVAAATAALGAAATAGAALPWTPCTPAGFVCSALSVPLDRAAVVPGNVSLSAARRVATSNPSNTAVVALAGGPGQPAIAFADDFATSLAPLLTDKDLLLFDERGTGTSGSLSCPALTSSDTSLFRVVRTCAQQLGPARGLYTTAQTVEDLEALRLAAGYDKLVIYGVSYGTKVALAYAAAHPAAVQSLVLDSVVTPTGPDALNRSSLAAVPRVIGKDLCGGGACTVATRSPVADIKQLAKQLDRNDLAGPVYTGSGSRRTAHLTPAGLVSTMIVGDVNPILRQQLPGAIRAALSKDEAPLLRLSVLAGGLDNSARLQQADATATSTALYYATICEEVTSFPWTRGASQSQRVKEANATVRFAPAGTFGIFPRSVAYGGLTASCVGWPVASAAPAAPGLLPNVPTLILAGQADLRTPLEDARSVARQLPLAQVIAVPHTGHSVLGSDPSGCATAALTAFAAGGTAAQCVASTNPYAPTAKPPVSLNQVRPVKRYPGMVGRTVRAAVETLVDGYDRVTAESISSGTLPKAVGGLRGGAVRVRTENILRFRGYVFVPGVTVSGTFVLNGTTRITISGKRAAHGTLAITQTGKVTGRVGGRRISLVPASGAAVRTKPERSFAAALKQARSAAVAGG